MLKKEKKSRKSSHEIESYSMAAVSVRLNPLGFTILLVSLLCVVFYWFGGLHLFQADTKVSMKQILCVSIDLAKRGGLRVKEIRESNRLEQKSKGKTKEGAKEMLTQGDLQSHRAIVYGFAKAFPSVKVISEEHEKKEDIDFKNIPEPLMSMEEVDEVITDDELVSVGDITVWVDPLDATQEYTEDLTQYVTTLVGVAVRGVPVIGVIHQPFEKQTAWAWVNYGHSPSMKIAKPSPNSNAAKRIIVSRSHAGKVEVTAKEAFGQNTEVIPAGGAGYKTLQVIQGNADAYVHITLIKKWDICAGNAILRAVGGTMSSLDGGPIDYSASSPVKVEKGLLATLSDHDVYKEKLAQAKSD